MIIDARSIEGQSIRGAVNAALEPMQIGDTLEVTDLLDPRGRSVLYKLTAAVSHYGRETGRRFATRGASTSETCTVFRIA